MCASARRRASGDPSFTMTRTAPGPMPTSNSPRGSPAVADRGMGRGLAAILSVSKPAEGEAEPPPELRELPLDLIRPNPAQPRKRFDEDALQGLAGSLAERGVVQPILVRSIAG